MTTRIAVKDKEEANLIRRGLARPDVRALVKIMGALSTLPTERARVRVMRMVMDKVDEERGR